MNPLLTSSTSHTPATSSNVQYMYLYVNRPSTNYRVGRHRVGVVAFRKNDNDTLTLATSMVSKSEPHGFVAEKGVAKATARLASRKSSITFKAFQLLNGYPLRQILTDLQQSTEHNFFHDVDWNSTQTKFERTLEILLARHSSDSTEDTAFSLGRVNFQDFSKNNHRTGWDRIPVTDWSDNRTGIKSDLPVYVEVNTSKPVSVKRTRVVRNRTTTRATKLRKTRPLVKAKKAAKSKVKTTKKS